MCAARTGQLLNLSALFETWVVSELYKQQMNLGQSLDFYFWLDHIGSEVDVVSESSKGLQAIEIKSGSTFASDWVNGVNKWQSTAGADSIHPTIVYGGAQSFEREGFKVWGWKDIGKVVKA